MSGLWLQARRTASRHRRASWRSWLACMAESWLTSVSSKVLSHSLVTKVSYFIGKLNALDEITRLQPISRLPSRFVTSRVFHSNTTGIHSLHAEKAYGCDHESCVVCLCRALVHKGINQLPSYFWPCLSNSFIFVSRSQLAFKCLDHS